MAGARRQKSTTKAGMSCRISDICIYWCRAITKTTGWKAGGTQGSVDYKDCLTEELTEFSSRTFKASTSRPVNDMEFRTGVHPSRRPGSGLRLVFRFWELRETCRHPRGDYPESSSGRADRIFNGRSGAGAQSYSALPHLSNKAGMSFNFIGMMLATAQSIKDSRLRRLDGRQGRSLSLGQTLEVRGALCDLVRGITRGAFYLSHLEAIICA